MSDSNDLLKMIKQSAVDAVEASKPVNVTFGTVISVSPLQIQVEQKLILQKEQLILSRNVTKHTISVTTKVDTENTSVEYDFSHDHTFNLEANGENVTGNIDNKELKQSKSHKHTINATFNVTLNTDLKANEKVILIRIQKGQQYLVLDRIGG